MNLMEKLKYAWLFVKYLKSFYACLAFNLFKQHYAIKPILVLTFPIQIHAFKISPCGFMCI